MEKVGGMVDVDLGGVGTLGRDDGEDGLWGGLGSVGGLNASLQRCNLRLAIWPLYDV